MSALMLLAWSVQAGAAGLGLGDAGATMGQPLNFAVAVRLDPGEALSPECVGAEVVVGDRRVPPPLVRTVIEMTSATTARVRVLTQSSVDEPVVQVQLGVGCSNRISRSYVVLADPPGTSLAPPPSLPPALAQAASPPAVAVQEPAAPAPRASASEPPGALPAQAAALTPEQIRARDERSARQREQRLARQRAAREAREARQRTESGRSAATPRLQIDLTEPAPSRSAGTAQSEALARALAAAAEATSAAEAAASAASASALRVASLEQQLAQLRIEGKSSRDLVSALREQLVEARASSLWTTPLTLASLLLAALAAWLAWRLGRVQAAQRQQWQKAAAGFGGNGPATSVSGMGGFDAPSTRSRSSPPPFLGPEARSTVIVSPEAPAVPATVALPKAAAAARANRAWPPPAPPVAWPAPPTTLSPDEAPVTVPGLHPDVKGAMRPADSPLFEPDTQAEPPMQRTNTLPAGGRSDETSPRDVSIEELIDLEQQAEFFVVLGQDEAAVDLLVEHLRTTGGGSPLPYLKLLEIHRRRGDHEAYERTRQRFNHRFNAYAPEWGVDLTTGRSLEDYVGVIPRLQQVWARPLDAMAELEALLFRKSRGELFELPAYREVLFLYALARDLLDRSAVDTGSVDLLLPMRDLEDEGAGDGNSAATPLGLEHDAFKDTMPPEDMLPASPLDFDVTNSDPPTSIFRLIGEEKRSRDPRK
ncbi:MAG: hypothetical protein ACK57B_09470 [Betaproteobacteria bacterium]